MDTDTAQHLLAALRESGLHPPERLDFAAQFLVASEDDVSLADQLLTHGLLTPYMHRKVRINRSYEILFGAYLILDKIGEGGMGKVYRAVQLGDGKLVALKVVRQHLVQAQQDVFPHLGDEVELAVEPRPRLLLLVVTELQRSG